MKRTRNPRFVKQYRDAAGTWINQYRRRGRLIRLPNGRDFNETWWKAYYAAEAEILSGETLLPAAAARGLATAVRTVSRSSSLMVRPDPTRNTLARSTTPL